MDHCDDDEEVLCDVAWPHPLAGFAHLIYTELRDWDATWTRAEKVAKLRQWLATVHGKVAHLEHKSIALAAPRHNRVFGSDDARLLALLHDPDVVFVAVDASVL